MNPLQEIVKGKTALREDNDFSIQNKAARRQLAERSDQLWEIAAQGLSGFGLQEDVIVIAECKTTEAIPLGFE